MFQVKNAAIALSLVGLLFVFQSCKKSDLAAEETVSPERIEELKAFLVQSTGHELTEIEYQASTKTFIVARDGVISLKDVSVRADAEPTMGAQSTEGTTQRVYSYTVSGANAQSISVYADNTVPAEWLIALDESIANWNSTNSLINFKRVTATTTTTTGGKGRGKKSGPTTTTTIPAYNVLVTTLFDDATSMIARAYYPDYNGNAGKQVDINTKFNYLSSSYKLFALTHELGHIIGFTHTDGTYGNIIPGTPETDPNSVMNSFVLPWNGFTNYDVVAVNTVYPR